MTTLLRLLFLPLPILGAVVALLWSFPRCRSLVPTVAPLTLGAACVLVGVWILEAFHLPITFAILGSSYVAIVVFTFLGGFAVTIVYIVEKRISAWLYWKKVRKEGDNTFKLGSLPPSLAFVSLPAADDSFRGVAKLAQRTRFFIAMTIYTVFAEEFLFRAVVILVCAPLVLSTGVALLVQAFFYSLNHLSFGASALVGKLLLGLSLGLITMASKSIVPAVLVHFLYQGMVLAQFRPRHKKGNDGVSPVAP